MDERIIFLDRDGVINQDPGGGGYVTSWKEFKFLPGSLEALKKLAQAGYAIVVISNQAGVGKGIYSKEALDEITAKMLEAVEKAGGKIKAAYYCIHKKEDNCPCRKPKAGLISQATKGIKVNFAESFFVGDTERDIIVGKTVGCKTIFVLSGLAKLEELSVKPDFVAKDLLESVEKIILKRELGR
jgi:histidinol-phosphate phosphatase family protein